MPAAAGGGGVTSKRPQFHNERTTRAVYSKGKRFRQSSAFFVLEKDEPTRAGSRPPVVNHRSLRGRHVMPFPHR